jgi:hypothetical protein
VRAYLLQDFVSARKIENACMKMVFGNKGAVKKADAGKSATRRKVHF